MLQKRRRTLTIEYLEDRLTPSGLVTAIQDPFTGAVFISGDNFNNQFQINRTTSVLGDVLSVAPIPGSHTAVNGITSGNAANFLLSSVSSLFISDGNGSNVILLGNLNGFSIPGNINVDVGSGTDNVQLKNISTNAGAFIFNGWHGAGTGTDTVNLTNVLAGESMITPGTGTLNTTQTNVTLGFDIINAANIPSPPAPAGLVNNSDNNITVVNSTFHPAPRLHAIGQMSFTTGNGNNTYKIDTIDVGQVGILTDALPVTGTGNPGSKSPNITFSHSNILQADITSGSEFAGSRMNSTVTMDTNTYIGQHLNLNVLDESGVSGTLLPAATTVPPPFGAGTHISPGGAGIAQTKNNVAPSPDGGHRNQVHIQHVTLNNQVFKTAFPITTPQLAVQVDDGDYYYDTQRGHVNGLSGNTFKATGVTLPGIATITLGDHFQLAQVGNIGTVTNGIPGTTSTGQMVAGQLFFAAENDLDTVIVAANVTGQFLALPTMPVPFLIPATEVVNLGDNTINPVQGSAFPATTANDQIAPPSVFTSGQVGTGAINGNMTFEIGNNLSIPGNVNGNNNGEPLGWPVKMSNNVLGSLQLGTGNLTVFPTAQPKLETGAGGGGGQGVASPFGADNGLAFLLDPMSVQGDLSMTLGSGGFNNRESLVMSGVTAGNIAVALNSSGTEIPDGNPNLGVYVALDNVQVTDTIFGNAVAGTPPGLTMTDFGAGEDFVWLGVIPAGLPGFGFQNGMGPVASDILNVQGQMNITLSPSGGNTLEAHNTTAAFGIVNGGGGDSTYTDDGGNAGYLVTGFIGH